MEKRFLLAFVLSLSVLLLWSNFVAKPTVPPAPPTVASTVEKAAFEQKQDNEIAAEPSITFSNDNGKTNFIESAGAIKDVVFNKYQSYKFQLKHGLLLENQGYNYKKIQSSGNTINFVQTDKDKKINKEFIFSNSNYDIELKITVQNLSATAQRINFPLLLGDLDSSVSRTQASMQDITVSTSEKVLHPNYRKDATFPTLKFVSLRDRYFCAILEPLDPSKYAGFVRKTGAQVSELGIISQEMTLEPGQQIVQRFHLYIGPQDTKIISSANPDWLVAVHYGTFDVISQTLLKLLGVLHQIVHSWGLAIVLLGIIIYLLLFPLTLKQMRSMKEMQILQPKIEQLRKTYKDNPQRLNKEVLELYKEHKVNPLGGCLPMILQIPIFFSLYQALMRTIALKGERFLWIKDLSEPDRLFILPVQIPILGNEINILPILMAIGMFVQQKLSVKSADSQAAEQQKIMMIVFPIMFGFIFYRMPSGLVLYWFVNSALTLAYQIRMVKSK